MADYWKGMKPIAPGASNLAPEPHDEIFHIFTCTNCRRTWTVFSKTELECFFFGLCYWCCLELNLKFEDVQAAIDALIKSKKGA